jgi:twitching motility protein PilT
VAEVRRDGSLSPRNTDTTALHRVLGEAVRAGASDVHFHERSRLRFRINGRLTAMNDQLLSPWEMGKTVVAPLTDSQYDTLCRDGEIDFPYTAPGIGRFRVNLFKQQHGIDAVFHSVPPQPPTLADLGLPDALGKLANYHQGIVLFTGPSGCGKSATMGAVLNLVNRERNDHIITIEDPIETLHPSLQAIVNQRQAKKHTASFGRALKAALREDPDVIVIGEMRDYETISLAISAAETGHLVMGTLHTGGAIRTISRVLGVFPPAQQAQVRSMVSESLRAVVSQRLVARADGQGRVAALEILYVNQAVANLIRENRTIQIKSVLQTGISQGMTSLDNSLETLVKAGTITREEAARHADEPKKFTNTASA